MKYFKQMCELVCRLGDSPSFFSVVPEARSIVINDINDVLKENITEKTRWGGEFYPPPFKVCAFEFHGKDWLITGGDRLKCMVVNETGPNEYEIFSMLYNEAINKNVIGRAKCISATEHATTFAFINSVTSLLNCGARGSQSTKDFVKFRNKHGKTKKYFLRKVVHICSKSKKENLTKKGLDIDWSHRWEVRGHWRDIPGVLGKDRVGDYCIEGKTWVTEHIKGPEEQPFIRKTRLLVPTQAQNNP
jgi:hypothetical protein